MTSKYQGVSRFLPTASVQAVLVLLDARMPFLKITKPRSTKLGDFRPGGKNGIHRISVNGNLNPYQFLITLIHEIAHLDAHNKWGMNHQPHGPEWQHTYVNLLAPFVESPGVFPSELQSALVNHLNRPAASSCADHDLYRALKAYDKPAPSKTTVETLPVGTRFVIGKRLFEKGPLTRTRYLCKELTSGKMYRVHPLAEVLLIPEKPLSS
jgi:SprT protein